MDEGCGWIPFNLDDVPTYNERIFLTFRNKIDLDFFLLCKDLLIQIEGRGPAAIAIDDESSVVDQKAAADLCHKYSERLNEELKVARNMVMLVQDGLRKGYEKLLDDYNEDFADFRSDMDAREALNEATVDMASLNIGGTQDSTATTAAKKLKETLRESSAEAQKRKLGNESGGTCYKAEDDDYRPVRGIRLNTDSPTATLGEAKNRKEPDSVNKEPTQLNHSRLEYPSPLPD